MKKISFIIAAMFAIAQMSAATTDAAPNSEAVNNEVATVVTDNNADDSDPIYKVSYPLDKEVKNTKHWTFETNGFYMGMGVKHSLDDINNSFEIGLLNILCVNYNTFHGQIISLGIGINQHAYSMKRPNMLYRGIDSEVVEMGVYPSDDANTIKNRSSNLYLTSFQLPVMFKQRIIKKLDVFVAGILNWNTHASVHNHYEMYNTDYDTNYKKLKQNKVSFDLMGGLSYDGFGIYCRYNPAKFFKDGYGPELNNIWTIGLMIGL